MLPKTIPPNKQPQVLAPTVHKPQPQTIWEQRWHPLREEWVLFTSHRGERPWVGETKKIAEPSAPRHEPSCALCPRNARLHGTNPDYTGVFVFSNDLPVFSSDAAEPDFSDPFYVRRAAKGTAEVVCYHPDHSLTFADLTPAEALDVIRAWTERSRELGARPEVNHVLIFENKGEISGASNPHPHCQIYASSMLYAITARMLESSRKFFERTGEHLGQQIMRLEHASSRVICQNESFIATVPWFARYAYEVLILPREPASSLADLKDAQQRDLAQIMVEVAVRYDNLWQMPFPYVMSVRQAPTDTAHPYFPFHIEYQPPLRKLDTMKYLAGPEIGGGSMTNESNPDEKAAELRAVPDVLYRKRAA